MKGLGDYFLFSDPWKKWIHESKYPLDLFDVRKALQLRASYFWNTQQTDCVLHLKSREEKCFSFWLRMLWCRNIPNQTISGQLSDMLLLSLLFVCFWSFVCHNLNNIFLYMCGVCMVCGRFFLHIFELVLLHFFLDLDCLNTTFKCSSVCTVSEKVAKNDIVWCHIPAILVEATSPCDLLLGAVSNRSICARMRISDYWGNFEGAKYADAWKKVGWGWDWQDQDW